MTITDTALSARLRQETKAAHTRAERSGIMRAFLTGQLPAESYVALLANLHTVYSALETGLTAQAAHPHVAPLYDPALHRVAALEADLTLLAGADWASRYRPTAAAEAYAARITELARTAPLGLVAHAYTRYLGDLSGGQILKRMVAPILKRTDGAGTAFYDFPGIPDPDAFKQRWRAALDALPLSAGEADFVVAEALGAFDANGAVFEALA